MHKRLLISLAVLLVLTAGACSRRDDTPPADEGRIHHVRNSAFSGPHLRVFLTLEDGTEVSVNSADDAVATEPGTTPIPGHQARNWTFVKDAEIGTSVAHGLVSWDPKEPADYLMAGWWAQFPDQHYPDLDFAGSVQYAIYDGPETDPAFPPTLPIEGRATYTGQAGGLYAYTPGSDWGEDEGTKVLDEYEGEIAIAADFAAGALSGCIGCEGDLVTRRAHFGIFLGDDVRDVRAVAADYELHFGVTALNDDGTFETTEVEVGHPDRTVTQSKGFWGGSLSNRQDADGNPRLVAGFSAAKFEESDGSAGSFFGAFLALSERLRASGKGDGDGPSTR